MKAAIWLKDVLEYLGGCQDQLPEPATILGPGSGRMPRQFLLSVTKVVGSSWFRGLWWALLAAGILFFCGQTSKFIYIDF